MQSDHILSNGAWLLYVDLAVGSQAVSKDAAQPGSRVFHEAARLIILTCND